MNTAKVSEIQFSDVDVVNPDDFVPTGDYNPHRTHPFLFHDAGFVLGIVFSDNLSDAFDELADSDKIEHFEISETEMKEEYSDGDDGRVHYLGNGGTAYDIETIDVVEMQNPGFSFVALFNARETEPDSREEIIKGMARCAFVCEFADAVDNAKSNDSPDADRLPNLSGCELYDVAPFDRMPASYYGWADKTAMAIERANDGKSLADIYSETERETAGDDDDKTFGHYLAMSFIGSGVSVSEEYRDGDAIKVPFGEFPNYIHEENIFLFREK